MNDDELTRKLREAAARVTARPDLGEVELGAGRLRGRRRVATGVAAAMLVAGAGGAGFGIGRAARGEQVGTADAPVATTPATVPAETTAPAPVSEPVADSVAPPSPNGEGAVTAVIEGDASGSEFYPPPATLVSDRTLGTGHRVRILRGQSIPMWEGSVQGGWKPAPYCFPTIELRVTIDGPDVVDVAWMQAYEEMNGDVMVNGVTDVGAADGRPMRLLVAQVAGDATQATVTWNDGASDAAPIEGGHVALLADAGTSVYEASYTLAVNGPSGEQTFEQSDFDFTNDPEFRAACEPPPPELPEPGEQPIDPDAARAEVEAALAGLWDRAVPADERWATLLDDDTGLAEALEVVNSSGMAQEAGEATFELEELVFTSPTIAWIRYGIETVNFGYQGPRFGVATLTDAGWIFPRAIICQDLALAGGVCDPPAETIYPPSWYEVNGPQCTYDPNTGAELDCVTYEESDIASWP